MHFTEKLDPSFCEKQTHRVHCNVWESTQVGVDTEHVSTHVISTSLQSAFPHTASLTAKEEDLDVPFVGAAQA